MKQYGDEVWDEEMKGALKMYQANCAEIRVQKSKVRNSKLLRTFLKLENFSK